MKAFVVLCLCGLSSVMLAAQSKPKAFTDPDGIFQFKYSPVPVSYTHLSTVSESGS